MSSSFASRVFFSWLNPLLRKSARIVLEHEDIWALSDIDRSERLVALFKQAKFKNLALRLFSVVWQRFCLSSFFCLTSAILSFGAPTFLNLIVGFIEHGQSQSTWVGLLFAAGLFVASIVKSWSDAQYFYVGRRVGIQIRGILISEIYEKSLRRAITASSVANRSDGAKDAKEGDNKDDEASLGKIVTLMSVDTRRLREIVAYLPWIFITPFQILFCVLALFSVLGWSAMAGVAVMVVSMPLIMFVSKYQYKMSDRYLEKMDKRVGVVNEMLQGIRIVKYFGWEADF
eukprot:jgi/Hompol1/4400/HPOL_007083-RA